MGSRARTRIRVNGARRLSAARSRTVFWLVVLVLLSSCGGTDAVDPDLVGGQLTSTTATVGSSTTDKAPSESEPTTTSSSQASTTPSPSTEPAEDRPSESDNQGQVTWTPDLLDQLHVVQADFQVGQWTSLPSDDELIFFDSPCSLQQPDYVYASASDSFLSADAALQMTSSWIGFGSEAVAIAYLDLWRTELSECPAVRLVANVDGPEEFAYANTAMTSMQPGDLVILSSFFIEDVFAGDQVGILRRHGAAVFQAAGFVPGPRPPELQPVVEELAVLLSERAVDAGLPEAE